MGKPAARLGDSAAHGGIIILGEPTVLICGLPAAREGDLILCPGSDGPVPHLMGNILKGSTTVMIGGSFVARQGDPTGCGSAGKSSQGLPAIQGPNSSNKGPDISYTGIVGGKIGDQEGPTYVEGKKEGEDAAGVLWGTVDIYDNDYGVRAELEGSLVHAGGKTDTPFGEIGGSVDFVNIEQEGHIGIMSYGRKGEISLLRGRSSWETSNDAPRTVGAGGEVKFLTIQGFHDVLSGTDGRRTGFSRGYGLKISEFEVEGYTKEQRKFQIPWTDHTIVLGSKIKDGVEGRNIGMGGHYGAFHDREDDKFHLKFGGQIGAVWGIEQDIDLWMRVESPPSIVQSGVGIPKSPGTILSGCPTVFIG